MSNNVFEDALSSLSKRFSSLKKLSDVEIIPDNVIPTGIDDIDYNLLIIGGIPKGRIIEISGQESGGKSTLCYRLMANCQKMKGNTGTKGRVALFDPEQSAKDTYGRDWLVAQGVDITDISYSNEIISEYIFTMMGELCKLKFDLIIVDSVPAMQGFQDSVIYGNAGKTSSNKNDKLLGEAGSYGGAKVKALGNALPELNKAASDGNTAIVFINQLRDNVGEMFGSPDKTPGGRALKFTSAVRLKVRKKKPIQEGEGKKLRTLGVYVDVFVQKSKVSPPFKRTGVDTAGYIPIYFDGRQVKDDLSAIVLMAKDRGIIEVAGSWYTYKGIKVQGEKKLIDAMTPELWQEMKDEIKAKASEFQVYGTPDGDEDQVSTENDDYDGAVDE